MQSDRDFDLEQRRQRLALARSNTGRKDRPQPATAASRFNVGAALRTLDTFEVVMPTYRVWKPYIPDALTILAGDYGDGKTWLALAIVSHGSRGWPLPDSAGKVPTGAVEPWHSLYLSVENDPSTLRFRIDRLGGDPTKITIWDTRVAPLPTLNNLGPLEGAIAQVRPRLVVIDPIQSVLGGKIDVNRMNEVRAVLDPLTALGRKYEFTPLVLMHLNKATTLQAKYRIAASIDFGAAARSVLVVARDPAQANRRVMVHLKANLGREGVAQMFTLEGSDSEVAFMWAGTSDLTADELLSAPPRRSEQMDTKADAAAEFLREALAAGPVARRVLEDQATAKGLSADALKRAAGRLRVRFSSQGFPRFTVWSLP